MHKDLTESVGNLAISIYGLFKLKEIIKGNFNEMIHHICIKNNWKMCSYFLMYVNVPFVSIYIINLYIFYVIKKKKKELKKK